MIEASLVTPDMCIKNWEKLGAAHVRQAQNVDESTEKGRKIQVLKRNVLCYEKWYAQHKPEKK